MMSVALTGNVAAGKSTVARWFAQWDATVVDSDALVAALQQPGTPTYRAIVRRFGTDVLRPDGSLDRSNLRARVLADPDALASLNAIVHPAVQRRRGDLLADARQRGDRIVVHDIPLLFEVLDPNDFDLVVLVDATPSVRHERLVGRGLPTEEIDRLMAAQLPSEHKRNRSDIVIDNNGSIEELRLAAEQAWREILRRAEE